MKKNLTLLVLLIALVSSLSYGQESQKNTYTDQFIKDCIMEVFQDQADELVFNTTSKRLEIIKDFFSRVEIVYLPKTSDEKMAGISNLKLNNKYNQNLQHDVVFKKITFNPLKYHFTMFPERKNSFRIDNDYIISVNPIN